MTILVHNESHYIFKGFTPDIYYKTNEFNYYVQSRVHVYICVSIYFLGKVHSVFIGVFTSWVNSSTFMVLNIIYILTF